LRPDLGRVSRASDERVHCPTREHALRHTHASALIAGGIDVVTVSRRLGHSNPTITLGVYAHLFRETDSSAAAIEKVLG